MKANISDLEALLAVARAKSFRGGARAIGSSASAVSDAVRRLERDFMDALQITPYHFICTSKVNHAKKLLREHPDKKLASIASACGFPDLRNFRNVFRRIEGMTPADYRANVEIADIPVRTNKSRH